MMLNPPQGSNVLANKYTDSFFNRRKRLQGLVWEAKYVSPNLAIHYSSETGLSKLIHVYSGDAILLTGTGYQYRIIYCSSDGTIKSRSDFITVDTVFTNEYYVRFAVSKTGGGAIDQTLINSVVSIFATTKDEYKDYVPVGESYVNSNTYIAPTWDLSGYYAAWDALVAADPTYVTKTLLVNEPTGLPMYRYDFMPLSPIRDKGDRQLPQAVLPKIIYLGTAHGNEKTAAAIDLRFFSDLVYNWKTNGILRLMRYNLHFIVVPTQNPYGFNNNSRYNSNSVDLNRNYPTGWVAGDHAGASALSEIETQTINALLTKNKDAILTIDSHNSAHIVQGGGLGYYALANDVCLNCIMDAALRISDDARVDYPLLQTENPGLASRNLFSMFQPNATLGGQLVRHFPTLGIKGILSEKSEAFDYTSSYDTEDLQNIWVNTTGTTILAALLNAAVLQSY